MQVSPPPMLHVGMNMRITLIAFATGRLGGSELRRNITNSPILQDAELPTAKATKKNRKEVIDKIPSFAVHLREIDIMPCFSHSDCGLQKC